MNEFLERLDLPPDLARASVSLAPFGVQEVAWPRREALILLDLIENRQIAVLGGDVLSSVAPLTYANANWHAEPMPDEEFRVYATRSQQAARTYIERYPDSDSWFVLVLDEASRISKPSPNEP